MATEYEPDECQLARAGAARRDTMSCFMRALDIAYLLGGTQSALHRRLGRLHEDVSGHDRPEEIDDLLAAWQMLHAFPFEEPSPAST